MSNQQPPSRVVRRRLTLVDLRDIAEAHGGQCLATEFRYSNSQYRWQCEQGHIWEATLGSAQRTWCPVCRRQHQQREALQRLKDLARSRGGECLSDEYIDSSAKMLWRCENGHQWAMNANKIQNGAWCSQCLGRPHHTSEANNRTGLNITPAPEQLAAYKRELRRLLTALEPDETSVTVRVYQ